MSVIIFMLLMSLAVIIVCGGSLKRKRDARRAADEAARLDAEPVTRKRTFQ